MGKKTMLLVAVLAGAILVICLQMGVDALAAESDDIPPPPEDIKAAPKSWEPLEFGQAVPVEWGTVISINRVEKGGESYTFWFLSTDGTLRGVTTREFTGPNRASFFPEVYVIHRR